MQVPSRNVHFQFLIKFKSGRKGDRQCLNVIMLAIPAKVNVEKVLKMIGDMVALLKREQLDDDHKSGVLCQAV